MASDQPDHHTGQSLEGKRFVLTGPEERRQVIDWAFDYRGDVTIELQSGDHVEGYVYDRDPHAFHPFMKVFPKHQSSPKIIRYEDVIAVHFSGEDTAFGKSWEDWVKKMENVSHKHSAHTK